jgi:hypothetical protein
MNESKQGLGQDLEESYMKSRTVIRIVMAAVMMAAFVVTAYWNFTLVGQRAAAETALRLESEKELRQEIVDLKALMTEMKLDYKNLIAITKEDVNRRIDTKHDRQQIGLNEQEKRITTLELPSSDNPNK